MQQRNKNQGTWGNEVTEKLREIKKPRIQKKNKAKMVPRETTEGINQKEMRKPRYQINPQKQVDRGHERTTGNKRVKGTRERREQMTISEKRCQTTKQSNGKQWN